MEILETVADRLHWMSCREEGRDFTAWAGTGVKQISIYRKENPMLIGIFTARLGRGRWASKPLLFGCLREATYAVETICWELCEKGYDLFQRWAEAHLKQRLRLTITFWYRKKNFLWKMAKLLSGNGNKKGYLQSGTYCIDRKSAMLQWNFLRLKKKNTAENSRESVLT